jgi:NADH dehydrogenase (ubiquinone) 1 alpha/beta subcomplex 1
MSQDNALANRVIAVLTKRLGIAPETITPTAALAEDLGVDSVDGVEFALALEREFNVTLPDAILVDVRTVQDVTDLLRERIQPPSEVASD